jgi:hypothetical protein
METDQKQCGIMFAAAGAAALAVSGATPVADTADMIVAGGNYEGHVLEITFK